MVRTKPRILVVSPSRLSTDPRVRRQLGTLRDLGRVTAAGFDDPDMEGVEFVSIDEGSQPRPSRARRIRLLLARQYTQYHRELPWTVVARRKLAGSHFDVIVANDAEAWPLAFELRGASRVVCDAHEYAPREFEDIWWWRLLYQPYKVDLCRRYLSQADSITTVCPGIADEYAMSFGIRPTVIMNAAPFQSAETFRPTGNPIRIVHHGAAIASRKIEQMIAVLDHLGPRFELELMLTPNDHRYVAKLRALGRTRPRLRFRTPVPLEQIHAEIRAYDIGLFLLEPTNFNYRHALPNKFFEFIQARLAIAIGPSPEMAALTKLHGLGVISRDFTPASLAHELNALTPHQIDCYRRSADRAARALSWEHESAVLRGEVERLLASRSCAA